MALHFAFKNDEKNDDDDDDIFKIYYSKEAVR